MCLDLISYRKPFFLQCFEFGSFVLGCHSIIIRSLALLSFIRIDYHSGSRFSAAKLSRNYITGDHVESESS
jgi:hypothetical protein